MIADIEVYPKTINTNREIAQEALNAFIFIPQKRVEGTSEEKELLRVIAESIQFRYRFERPRYRRSKRSRKYFMKC